jgi:DNA-binding transcriptional ArsR family regulator
MSRDPTSNSVLQFKRKRPARRPTNLAEALLLPTPLEPDAGDPLPPSKKLYGQVPIEWLCDRANDRDLSRAMRLYLYLQIKSRRGARSVRLTNEMANELGLDRAAKTRALKALEARGQITVSREGKRLPIVIVRRLDVRISES